MGAADEDTGTGGGQPKGIRDVFQGVITGNVAFSDQRRGCLPPAWMVPDRFSSQGCTADHIETYGETGGGGIVIPTTGDSNVGGELRGDRGLHPKNPEHGRAIYCDATNSGPLREVGEEARSLGLLEVAGTRRAQRIGCKRAG